MKLTEFFPSFLLIVWEKKISCSVICVLLQRSCEILFLQIVKGFIDKLWYASSLISPTSNNNNKILETIGEQFLNDI